MNTILSPICPHCHQAAKLVNGAVIYPHRPDLKAKQFWNCAGCRAYVGCHPGTDIPLGRLANASLRAAKQKAHAAFDPLWKSGRMTRKQAYTWLAGQLGVKTTACHIGMFDETECNNALLAVLSLPQLTEAYQ